MAKVIMFSRHFPKYHPKAGQPTNFVAKFWANPRIKILNESIELLKDEYLDWKKEYKTQLPKGHTIRAGHRFKKGDMFSPRVWTGKPYRTKQIIISPDTEVLKTWDFEITKYGVVIINDNTAGTEPKNRIEKIAANDGLSREDFENWFSVLPFKGQIICWNPNINY